MTLGPLTASRALSRAGGPGLPGAGEQGCGAAEAVSVPPAAEEGRLNR